MSILAPPYLNSPSENNHIDAPTICRRLEIRDVSPILIRRSAYNQAYVSDSKYKSISNLDLDFDLDFDLDLELGVSPPRPLKTPSNLSHSRIKTKRWFNIYNYVYNYIYK